MKVLPVAAKATSLIFAALFLAACSSTDTSEADAAAAEAAAAEAAAAEAAAEAAEAAEADGFASLLIDLVFGSAAATPAIVEIYVNIADDIAI